MIVENISQRPGRRVHVVQGEHYVTDDPDVVLTTILGSCVAVCLWDPVRAVGGMNHFLLRHRLEAKLFGGARTMQGLGDIGATNARFAEGFLKREGIAITGGSLGGETGRRIQFWPVTGRVRQKLVRATEEPRHSDPVLPAAGELELF